MTGKGKGKEKQQRRALTVRGKHQICKSDWTLSMQREALAVYGAHFTGEKGEPVKTSTMSDLLKKSAKWPAMDVV